MRQRLTLSLTVLRTFMAAQEEICPEARPAEEAGALGASWWTFLLIVPVHLFATNPSFLGLANYGSENKWGLCTGIVALEELIAIKFGTPLWRLCAVLSATFMWEFIAVDLASTSIKWHGIPVNTGVGAYTTLSYLSIKASYRLWRHAQPDVEQRWQRSRLYAVLHPKFESVWCILDPHYRRVKAVSSRCVAAIVSGLRSVASVSVALRGRRKDSGGDC